MRKLVSLLAIMLMACPVVALGATYVDTFDNAVPDQSWTFQDDTAAAPPNAGTELWVGGTGQALNSGNYTVGFGGTANIDATGLPPLNMFGILSDSSFNPIPYVGGSLTVTGVLNADGPSAAPNDHALIGFMGDPDSSGYQDAYLLMVSPAWHYVALYSVQEVGSANQQAMRLDKVEWSGSPGDPLMDIPVDCTMQIETISPGGNLRISVLATGDFQGTGVETATYDFVVGVDTPDTGGHDPSPTTPFGPADVPKLYGGATGFAGVVIIEDPQPLNVSVDDFASWDSLKGDFNLDGYVDVTDLGILATNYNLTSGGTVFLGDSTFDGMVNVSDLGVLATYYNTNVWAAAGAAVPEPTTMTMLVLGVLALLIRRRR